MIRPAEPSAPGAHAFVVEGHDGAVVGRVQARAHGPVWHIEELTVVPASRGKGIGGDLLDAIEALARESGALATSLRTYRDLRGHEEWFVRRGYEVVDPPPSSMDEIIAAEAGAGLLDGPPRVAMLRQLVEPVTPRVAVSVVPLRDGPGGLEVFVQHRASTMDFAAGAVVFPGGRVDDVDRKATGMPPRTPRPQRPGARRASQTVTSSLRCAQRPCESSRRRRAPSSIPPVWCPGTTG